MPFLVIASFFFGAWTSIVLHESSHALAGHLANLQIREFRVGLGPTVLNTRLLGVDIRVGTIPIAGRVRTFPQLFYSKSANLLLVAAGPAMDVVWLVVLLGAMSIHQDSQLAGSILAPAVIFQIMMVIGNVFPHSPGSTASGHPTICWLSGRLSRKNTIRARCSDRTI
ncbi:MAG: site-2 protease family protein [Mesorhizobium sp.]|nr:site-2 protease family protein [Mesorhizobium sp.]